MTRYPHSKRDERGVALVLALSFMVLIGVVTSALLSSLITSVSDRAVLDNVRNRQYAADAAVEMDIARVRALGGNGPALASCGGFHNYSGLNGQPTMRVECTDIPIGGAFLQRNVVFTSCINTGATCAANALIVRAQVNYEAATITSPIITKTYVQSWTVSR